MALVPANIVVTFTANYDGQHRVCYREGNSGPYTCTTTSCTIGTCEAIISIFVDNETCDTVQYNGYVQASCQALESEVDRIPFSVSFIPAPGCKLYTVTCNNAPVASATITEEGVNYNPAVPPLIVFSGGGGSGAAATAVIGEGEIISVDSITPGSGYNDGSYTNVDVTGGSGTGALASVNVGSGLVTAITITNPGTGYQSSDVPGLSAADLGGSSPSVPASFNITSDYGTLIDIEFTNFGTGYTSAPAITIPPSGGGQATATAVLASCPNVDTDGCTGGVVTIPTGVLDVGDSVSLCNVGGIVTPGSQFTVVEAGNCLCDCVTATIGVTGTVMTQVRYFYNRCGAGVQTGLLTVSGSPSSIIDCIVPGSLVFQTLTPGTVGTVSYGGAC